MKFPSKTNYKEVSEATDVAIIRNMVCGTSDSVVNAVWNSKELQSRILKKLKNKFRRNAVACAVERHLLY